MITKTSHFMGHSKIRWVIWAILEGFIIGIQRSDSDYEVSMHWLIVDTLSPIDLMSHHFDTLFWVSIPSSSRNLGVILFDTFLLFFFLLVFHGIFFGWWMRKLLYGKKKRLSTSQETTTLFFNHLFLFGCICDIILIETLFHISGCSQGKQC